MREIKFRSWCGQQKRMFSKVIVGNTSNPKSDDYTAHCIYRDGDWYHVDHHDTDVYFMQFTGLKDKNGVEIYEGDIVHSPAFVDNCNHYVDYFDDLAAWFIVDDLNGYAEMLHDYIDGLKVIGNIHQNPELLED